MTLVFFWLIALSVILLGLSLYLLSKYGHYRSLVKQKGLFAKWPIRTVGLEEVDPIFQTNEFGPTINTAVQFIGRGHLIVPGGTSDTEAWVLSVLAKKANRIFEFGTCTGKTTYLMAQNCPGEGKVTTLTLSPDEVQHYSADSHDSKSASRNAVSESKFAKFLYSGTPAENKITQLFGDSKYFDETPYEKKMDLIFIDGSHALSYVNSDSQKAFKMVSPGGLILWHDYQGPDQADTRDVYRALNKLSKEKPLKLIKGTSLVVFRNRD